MSEPPPSKRRRLASTDPSTTPADEDTTAYEGDAEPAAPVQLAAAGPTSVRCSVCSKSFRKQRNLEAHERRHAAADGDEHGRYTDCPYCAKPIRLRKDGTLGDKTKHFSTAACQRARKRLEYEHAKGPLTAGKRLPPTLTKKGGKVTKMQRRPEPGYLNDLEVASTYVQHRATGKAKYVFWADEMASYHGLANHAVPPFHEPWIEEEKQRFFYALSRHSRFRPDLIAEDVGTRTTAEVDAYLALLASYSAATSSLTRDEHPTAYEVTDDWLRWEETQAYRVRHAAVAYDSRKRADHHRNARKRATAKGVGTRTLERQALVDAKDDLLADLSWRHLCSLGRDHSAAISKPGRKHKVQRVEDREATEDDEGDVPVDGESEDRPSPMAQPCDDSQASERELFSSSASEVSAKAGSGSTSDAEPPTRSPSPSPIHPSSTWRDVDASQYDGKDEEDLFRLARAQLQASSVSRADFGNAKLLDLHAIGTLLRCTTLLTVPR
jgi:DNA-directed RNA polymerase subunit RPC12/RpoP